MLVIYVVSNYLKYSQLYESNLSQVLCNGDGIQTFLNIVFYTMCYDLDSLIILKNFMFLFLFRGDQHPGRHAERQLHILFMPKDSEACCRKLKELNVFGSFTNIEAFGAYLLPLDTDLLTMDNHQFIKVSSSSLLLFIKYLKLKLCCKVDFMIAAQHYYVVIIIYFYEGWSILCHQFKFPPQL